MNIANQPAFPTIGDITHNPSLSTEHGMTLRQYYAGQERSEPPGWFKHEPLAGRPKKPNPSLIEDEAQRKIVDDWMKDAISDLPKDLQWFDKKLNDWVAEDTAWEQKDKLSRIAQWKVACADALISELEHD